MAGGFDDLDFFFADFAVDCRKPDGTVVPVVFEVKDNEVLGSMVISSEKKIVGKTTDLLDLLENDVILVDGESYTVRKCERIEDGKLTEVRI